MVAASHRVIIVQTIRTVKEGVPSITFLRGRLHTLQFHLPQFNSQERAPKGVMLEKATDYIWSLRRTHSKQQFLISSSKYSGGIVWTYHI